MKEKLKLVLLIIIAALLVLGIALAVNNAVKAANEEVVNPVATFEIQDYGNVKIELYPEYAPNTVANFIALIEAGYYNNKVISGKDEICLYMGRDADEEAKGPTASLIDSSIEAGSEADYEYEINGEFIANKFAKNTLSHDKGIISLNRSDYSAYGLKEEGYNSGNARFSIMMTESSILDGIYCAFGRVTEGLEILEKIYNEVQVQELDAEETAEGGIQEFASVPVITNVTVEKSGVDYKKPEVHKAFDFQGYINELYSSYYTN